MIDFLTITLVVLAIIIIYFLIRLRTMLKRMPGATSRMNTMELIKNWQEQKAKDTQNIEEIREKAKAAAQPKIEEALITRYTQEEVDKALGNSTAGKDALKRGLGIDADKIFSKDNIDRVTGRGGDGIKPINPGIDSDKVFDRTKIQGLAQGGNMTPNRIRQASGHIDYGDGVRRSLDSSTQFKGLKRAVRRELKDDDEF